MPVQSLKLPFSSLAPHTGLTGCVWPRTYIRTVSVNPLLQSHAMAQHHWVKGGGTSISAGSLCSSPVHTGWVHAHQVVSLPPNVRAYATSALQFYRKTEHGTWRWQFLTQDATDVTIEWLSFTWGNLQKLLALLFIFINIITITTTTTITVTITITIMSYRENTVHSSQWTGCCPCYKSHQTYDLSVLWHAADTQVISFFPTTEHSLQHTSSDGRWLLCHTR